MTRAQRAGFVFALGSVGYILAFLQILPVPLVSAEIAEQVLPLIPWWLLVTFGSYSLWSLGWGLWTFHDCPRHMRSSCLCEIAQAKTDLRAKGVLLTSGIACMLDD
ncbi:dolichol-phosphate mannosyltransferase subunit 3 [Schizophyllum amplum]|uniref:Dolichol-phosphate mannosyltransferase subunit 3 n=1 Tax=Schizophyllum amplum TaxID=97359 RepID=A0A550CBD9_9AGAR|nr:dolichol-phosphate mannosyltransferase subunit 3 [Auriculariopsis ampla]